ncbi:unnamed protein product [Effrenium voratum]|uniref:TPM domain-containing protein n=1 Tax=Effrenium voratum TaxID=2562239 RepID=A0AA36INN9_9DINO|nr:unnamed protein product [Effrenium voratum]
MHAPPEPPPRSSRVRRLAAPVEGVDPPSWPELRAALGLTVCFGSRPLTLVASLGELRLPAGVWLVLDPLPAQRVASQVPFLQLLEEDQLTLPAAEANFTRCTRGASFLALKHGAFVLKALATKQSLQTKEAGTKPSARPLASAACAAVCAAICRRAESGGRLGARKRPDAVPMEWAKEARLARWRRRVAAWALAALVLLAGLGGCVSNSKAGALQSRLQQKEVEYVYRQSPFRLKSPSLPSVWAGGGRVAPGEVGSPYVSNSWVSDMANVLSPKAKRQIDEMAAAIRKATGAEVVVVTVPGVRGAEKDRAEVKRFSTRLFNSWGLGDKLKNNGVLVLVSTGDRRIEVEIGKGLNNVFNRDDWLKDMIRSKMVGHLRRGEYDAGCLAGVSACCEKLRNTDEEISRPQRFRSQAELLWAVSGFSLLACGFLVLNRGLQRPPPCACGARMGRLRDALDDELSPGQRAERDLGSVRHVLCGCGRPGCRKVWAPSAPPKTWRSVTSPRLGGAVRRGREVVLEPQEVQEAAQRRQGLGILEEVPWSRFHRCPACGFRTAHTRSTLILPGLQGELTECYFCPATSGGPPLQQTLEEIDAKVSRAAGLVGSRAAAALSRRKERPKGEAPEGAGLGARGPSLPKREPDAELQEVLRGHGS